MPCLLSVVCLASTNCSGVHSASCKTGRELCLCYCYFCCPPLPLMLLQVEAEGRHSSWNVDGELLRHGRVNVGIHAGLVDVFARGVELM